MKIYKTVLSALLFLLVSGTTAFATPQKATKRFLTTAKQKVRLSLCTPSLLAVMKNEVMQPFQSWTLNKTELRGSRARLHGVAVKKGNKVRIRVVLVKKNSWKVDDFYLKTGRRWFSMRMVLKMKQAFANIAREPTKVLATKSVKGMSLKLGKQKKQRKNYLTLTFDYKAKLAVKLKKVEVKGLKNKGYSRGGQFISHSFTKPAKFPFKTDITLTFVKRKMQLKGKQCVVMPKLQPNTTHKFPKAKGKGVLQFQHYGWFVSMGSAGVDEFMNYKTKKVILVGGTKVYLQGPKYKGHSVRRKRFMIVTGILKGVSKWMAGELKLFVDGQKASFPKIKLKQTGKNLAFRIYTNDFFYSRKPFKTFRICYTPKQFNPDNYFIFRFKDIVIP